MSTLPKNFISPEQYLEIERAAERKSEYYNGEMFAMSGARASHNTIVSNVNASLRQQFRGRDCRVWTNDMRIRVSPTGLYTYPDIVGICGNRRFLDVTQDTLLNPTVIFEVLSPSTEKYDRGRKFQHYGALESLQQYVLVASEWVSVEVFTRQSDGGWLLHRFVRLEDTAALDSIGCHLPLAVVYEDVEFETGQPPI